MTARSQLAPGTTDPSRWAAHAYFGRMFSAVEPDIALVVADKSDWPGRKSPYGLPFFTDDAGEIRPGVVVMSAGGGDFWVGIAQDLHDASPRGYAKLRTAKMFEVDSEDGLLRFWDCFNARDRVSASEATAASLAPLLRTEVSRTLGRAVRDWR